MRSELFIVHLLLLASGEFSGALFSYAACTQQTFNCDFTTIGKRNIDGSCNNIDPPHNSYGRSNTAYGRFLTPLAPVTPVPYKSFYGYLLPKPRDVSRDLFTCVNDDTESTLTRLAGNFGLFLMHDMFSTGIASKDSSCCDSCYGIKVDKVDDPLKTCLPCIPYHKPSLNYDVECSLEENNGLNLNTHYIDASPIFGSTQAKFDSLIDAAGKLKMSGNFLEKLSEKFVSGDDRINEQPLIMAVYHLFANEYNRLFDKMTTMNIPNAAKDAKKITIAILQHITYNEFLPLLLGQSTSVKSKSSGYTNYDTTKKPEVYNSFSIAYKLAVYSMLRGTFKDIAGGVIQIRDHRQNASPMDSDAERDNIVNRLLAEKSFLINNHFDCLFINDCLNKDYAFGDIAASAIQDSRYLSIAPYIIWLEITGATNPLSLPYHSESEKTKLNSAYTSGYDIDFASAVLSENPTGDSMVGPTLKKLFEGQFKVLKDSDRFYYEHSSIFTPTQLESIRQATMAHLICKNTGIVNVKKEAFKANSVEDHCINIKEVNLCPWKSTDGVIWSSWTSFCINTLRVRTRQCESSDQAACACSGVPIEISPCFSTGLMEVEKNFVNRVKDLVFNYYINGIYNGIESFKDAITAASG